MTLTATAPNPGRECPSHGYYQNINGCPDCNARNRDQFPAPVAGRSIPLTRRVHAARQSPTQAAREVVRAWLESDDYGVRWLALTLAFSTEEAARLVRQVDIGSHGGPVIDRLLADRGVQ